MTISTSFGLWRKVSKRRENFMKHPPSNGFHFMYKLSPSSDLKISSTEYVECGKAGMKEYCIN